MRYASPLVSDSKNKKTYHQMMKYLKDIEGNKVKVGLNLQKISDQIFKERDPVVCNKFMDVIREHFESDFKTTASRLYENLKDPDNSIKMHLIDMLVSYDELLFSEGIMDSIKGDVEKSRYEYTQGRLALANRNKTKAKEHFIRCYLTDPSFFKVYK